MYHLTPTGPKPCNAKDRNNCPYHDRQHGELSELQSQYESDIDTAETLKKQLTRAAVSYYQGSSDSTMTDEEYDAGINFLRKLSTDYDLKDDAIKNLLDGKVAGGTAPSNDSNKVHHDVPMLSLRKADSRQDVEDYVRKMISQGATGFKMQAKLDGIACSAMYEKGALKEMSTRGNGETGEDMSYLIDSPDVKIKGLPDKLKGKLSNSDIELRGELFLRPSEFNKINDSRREAGETEFANPRNTNAGIVKRAASGMNGSKATLQFVCYKILSRKTTPEDIIDAGVAEVSQVTEDEWVKTGASIPGGSLEVAKTDTDDVDSLTNKTMAIVDAFDPVREQTDLSLDGIVIKPVNENEMDEKMGHNSHHPLSQLAYKYPGAKAAVKITGVDWTVGKSGKLTPRLNYERTWLGGSWNEHATLHNTGILNSLNIKIGSVIEIEKRHDILPEISTDYAPIYTPDKGNVIKAPEHCPYCGSFIKAGDRLSYCPNEKCPSRGAYMLKAAAGKGSLNFDGMGNSLIESLQDSGRVSTIADFYDLDEKTLADTPVGVNKDDSERKFGEKRAKHVMEYIEKSKQAPFHKVLASLSIPDLGTQTAKALVKKYPDIDSLHNATIEDMSSIPDIGEKTAEKVKNGIDEQWDTIERLRKAGLQMSEQEPAGKHKQSNPRIEGKKFTISGTVPDGFANRGEWQEYVEAMGGTAQGAPSKDTDFIVGDPSSSSSKIVKAKKLGIRIISPADFVEMMK